VEYLRSFGHGEALDLVHLACLARCWANIPTGIADPDIRNRMLQKLATFRALDGGYHQDAGAARSSAYGSFLATGAYEDLGAELPEITGVLRSLTALRAADGGFANHAEAMAGSTPTTAAAVTLFRHLHESPPSDAVDWLLSRFHPSGGFFAAPAAPAPDLLSTATALHALVGAHAPLDVVKEPCLDFLETLWSSEGGFYGHWADDHLDCEYTFYALLALGHLSLR
jgi:prenyltransferase beta subunit